MTTINTVTVIENTKRELTEYVSADELTTIVTAINKASGVEGLKSFEDSVTIMSETGNHDALLDYMEELMEEHL